MKDIRIRYTFKRKSDGHIWQEIVPIGCLENKGDKPFILECSRDIDLWEVIGRDLFTGLKDKNGTDIYERDIIKEDWVEKGETFVVTDLFYPLHHNFAYNGNTWEIIGNIYQNENLLKS